MRVAFLLDTFPKTSETFFVSQIVGLIERGHSVDIFARYRNRSEPIHPEVEKHQLLKRTKYLIPESRQERLLAASEVDYTIVRTPRLMEGPFTGTYRVLPDALPSGATRINRADVADFMLQQLTDPRFHRQGPYIGSGGD